jgi:transposase
LALAIKKTLVHPKADAELRSLFKEKINHYQAEGLDIVYLDERGYDKDMLRTHGYAPIGQRCYGIHNWKSYGRTNAIGALLGDHLVTVSLFQTNINALVFKNWLLQDLLPKLTEGCIIVMDNAAFHKSADIKQLIEQAGHTLEYLPPYSPDLNPIEKKWAHAKAIRRTYQCTIDEIFLHYSM